MYNKNVTFFAGSSFLGAGGVEWPQRPTTDTANAPPPPRSEHALSTRRGARRPLRRLGHGRPRKRLDGTKKQLQLGHWSVLQGVTALHREVTRHPYSTA